MTRITPAEVREFGARLAEDGVYLMAAKMRRLAKQMEADEERMKGRVLVRPVMITVSEGMAPIMGGLHGAKVSDTWYVHGNTPEEALANLQRAIDEEAQR